MLDFGLVREALEERGLLLTRLAPHLVRPVPFLYPLTHHGWERPYVGAGLALYDAMAMAGKYDMGVPRHKHLTRRGALRLAPDLRPDALVGAIRYYDAQVDDARHTMMLARTAATHGAHVASRTKVVAFLREGERVTGARVVDLETGREIDVRARVVVNAAGVWTNDIQELVGGRGSLSVQASKGIHLVVPRDRIRSETGLILRTEKSVLFVIPWGRHWIIGTTDTPWDLDKAHPAASRADIDYLLGHVNPCSRSRSTHEDVEGVYAGLRPLASGRVRADQPDLARAHRGRAGARAGDDRRREVHHLPRDGPRRRRRRGALARRRRAAPASPTSSGWSAPTASRRAPTSATRSPAAPACTWPASTTCSAGTAASSTSCSPWSPSVRTWARRSPGAEDYLRAEVVYAVSHEGARHLDDVLTRRTRISIETFDRGVACGPPGRRADGRRARLGRRPASTRRSTTTCAGSRPSGRASSPSPTRRPTRPGSRAPDIV